MAAKVRILKLLQEMRGLAEITQRRPQPRQPGLILIQLRSHTAASSSSSRRKQIISVDSKESPNLPDPVKITHLRGNVASRRPAAL
jgi:hypothetical protein